MPITAIDSICHPWRTPIAPVELTRKIHWGDWLIAVGSSLRSNVIVVTCRDGFFFPVADHSIRVGSLATVSAAQRLS